MKKTLWYKLLAFAIVFAMAIPASSLNILAKEGNGIGYGANNGDATQKGNGYGAGKNNKNETAVTYSSTVYVYVQIIDAATGKEITTEQAKELGLTVNGHGWCTVGEIKGVNIPEASSSLTASDYTSKAVSALTSVSRYTANKAINLNDNGISWKLIYCTSGADNYLNSGDCWHLNGTLKVNFAEEEQKEEIETPVEETPSEEEVIEEETPSEEESVEEETPAEEESVEEETPAEEEAIEEEIPAEEESVEEETPSEEESVEEETPAEEESVEEETPAEEESVEEETPAEEETEIEAPVVESENGDEVTLVPVEKSEETTVSVKDTVVVEAVEDEIVEEAVTFTTTSVMEKAEIIEDNATPLSAVSSWAFVNMIMMIMTAAFTAVTAFKKSNAKTAKVITSVAVAVASIALFFLTQNLSGVMSLVDKWTALQCVIAVAQLAVTFTVKKNAEETVNA